MGEGGGRGRIGQVIGGHVDGLHGGDGPLVGGGNTLLQTSQISGQSRLVTDSGGDATQQSRHLRVGLGEAEDVVNEEQHVLSLEVTEVLGDGETGKTHARAGSWGLVHLAVHQSALGLRHLIPELDHTGLDHLSVEIVPLAGALPHTGEHGEPSVPLSDVVDELHNEHGLADTGATEKTNLATLLVGSQEIHDLDTGHQHLLSGTLISERGSLTMDGKEGLAIDGTKMIDGLANHVHNAAEGSTSHGNPDGRTGGNDTLSTGEALSGLHRNGAHGVLSEMLGNLEHDALVVALHLERVQDVGQLTIELHVYDGTDNLGDLSNLLAGSVREATDGDGVGVYHRVGLRNEARAIAGDVECGAHDVCVLEYFEVRVKKKETV
mmetsp:Transcript_38152/g.64102  ORF Transcript_38152/g.64102 Transcript_38152/m.64102 type:complete len:379 (-) Transcript_38152:39-1175(-)